MPIHKMTIFAENIRMDQRHPFTRRWQSCWNDPENTSCGLLARSSCTQQKCLTLSTIAAINPFIATPGPVNRLEDPTQFPSTCLLYWVTRGNTNIKHDTSCESCLFLRQVALISASECLLNCAMHLGALHVWSMTAQLAQQAPNLGIMLRPRGQFQELVALKSKICEKLFSWKSWGFIEFPYWLTWFNTIQKLLRGWLNSAAAAAMCDGLRSKWIRKVRAPQHCSYLVSCWALLVYCSICTSKRASSAK